MSDRLSAALTELVDAIRAEIAAVTGPGLETADRLLSIDEAAHQLGIGRSRLYDEIAAGRLWSLKVGRRRLVPSRAITSYVNGKPARVIEATASGQEGRHRVADRPTAA